MDMKGGDDFRLKRGDFSEPHVGDGVDKLRDQRGLHAEIVVGQSVHTVVA